MKRNKKSYMRVRWYTLLTYFAVFCAVFLIHCLASISIPVNKVDFYIMQSIFIALYFILLMFAIFNIGIYNIKIDHEGIIYKRKVIKWEDCYLSISRIVVNYVTIKPVCVLFFSDHYISYEEIKNKSAIKKAKYVVLNVEIISEMLKYYNKKVEIVDSIYTPLSLADKNIMQVVDKHNFSM